MFCQRFGLEVHVTRHAWERMAQRKITRELLLDVLETGDIRYKDTQRLWVAKEIFERDDNMVCAAIMLEDRLVVKTVMHHFSWEE
ncbi:DUF4258 domain-containing protein [Halomonas vilamensis]|uniref:DUF4258 domain-containing protein n=1 Tax=Vreelandella vilamensis TaxID=531309 RepID=A0ABU1H698_9GAMM|nr:DUF4258 domain-containing protein [Halomonas vilamensis]MDR5899827.1 DUF4258 domain-containing protein [Halomonas vilamensis]